MRKIIVSIISAAALVVITASVPVWSAEQGILPSPPTPRPFIRCAPDIAAPSILLVRHGQTAKLYPVKAERLLSAADQRRAVPCVWVAS